MTEKELETIEAELQRRGYRKYTTALTSSESWAWFKSFSKKQDEDGEVTYGYQIAFRVWDFQKYKDRNAPDYGFDFWTSALGADSRLDFTSNWEPICYINDTYREIQTLSRVFGDYRYLQLATNSERVSIEETIGVFNIDKDFRNHVNHIIEMAEKEINALVEQEIARLKGEFAKIEVLTPNLPDND